MYIDDGDSLCHPMLAVPDLEAASPGLRINDVRSLASVSTAAHGNVTLGVAVSPG